MTRTPWTKGEILLALILLVLIIALLAGWNLEL